MHHYVSPCLPTGSPEATPTAPTTASPAEGGSEAGRKRTAEEARLEKRELSKRAADSYGAWTTVAIRSGCCIVSCRIWKPYIKPPPPQLSQHSA